MTLISSADFKAGMRPFGAAVNIITTAAGGQFHGVTATAVCSVSAEPPSLLVCINRSASIHDPVRAARHFCVNLLAAEQVELARRFSSSDEAARRRRFEGLAVESLKTGSPVLPDAVAAYDCELVETVESATHTIFIGLVAAMRRAPGNVDALMYRDGQFGVWSPLASALAAE
ncbi:flavin reductase family protein [Ferrovibrio sp.]|uniref:flavin reductase family protein n=1 Tax=Ferrovibrio sp. TaxID=1917215 RepID=UPI0035AE0970